ncbi:MAG: tetratricopeptide repeat protein [Gammaproteobacteria bacterium]
MRRLSRDHKYFFCGILVFLVLQCTAWGGTPRDLFDKGVEAFRREDYITALRFFEQARSGGLDDNRLYYNLGVTYYKLGRYVNSKRAFSKTMNDPAMVPLASYNLGLVALAQNDNKQAAEWFRKALDTSKSDKLAQLSIEQLRKLGYETPVRRHKAYPAFAMIRGSLGYDDNAVLQADILPPSAAHKGDSFLGFFAYGNKQIAQFGNKAVQIEASLFDIRYRNLDAYDLDDLYLGAVLENTIDHWTVDTGLSEDVTFIGGNALNRTATLQLAGTRKISDGNKLRLRYKLSRVDNIDAAYSYLTGWWHQAQVDSIWKVGWSQIRLTYRFEYNDRQDLQAPLFTSYSPTRHMLGARGTFPVVERIKAEIDLRYRYSAYHNASEQFNGSYITRSDKRYRVTARIIYNLDQRANVTGEYSYTDNHSNIPIEQYRRNQYQLNLSYLW